MEETMKVMFGILSTKILKHMSHQTSLELDSNQESQRNSFYKTIDAPVKEMVRYEHSAKSQEGRILKTFQDGIKRTALQVTEILNEDRVSVRRGITNLCTEGRLIKLDEQVMERRGRNNHYYQLKK